MKKNMKGFFGEFYRSWGWNVCRWTLIIILFLLVLLYSSSLIFDDSSMYFFKNKHEYTFKIIEIGVSIFAFVGLIWSITYQREELLQSREELQQSREDLKIQSESVNRSIDETNKNFDREMLLEFYRKIDNLLVEEDLELVSFLLESRSAIENGSLDVIKKLDSCVRGGGGGSAPLLQNILKNIYEIFEMYCPKNKWGDEKLAMIGYARAYESSHVNFQLRKLEDLRFRVERSIVILLYNMFRYAKKKHISLDDPVFSLISTSVNNGNFFMTKDSRYRITAFCFYDICEELGLVKEEWDSRSFEVEQEWTEDFNEFLSDLEYLNLIFKKDSFERYLKDGIFSKYKNNI